MEQKQGKTPQWALGTAISKSNLKNMDFALTTSSSEAFGVQPLAKFDERMRLHIFAFEELPKMAKSLNVVTFRTQHGKNSLNGKNFVNNHENLKFVKLIKRLRFRVIDSKSIPRGLSGVKI